MNHSLFDTHCHPQFPQFNEDRDEVIRRALSQGIGMLCVGTDLKTSRAAIALAEQYEGLYASVGLHPNDALEEAYDESEYQALLDHEKVVAVGEIGLDYYRTKDAALQKKQRERFESQLAMAARLHLPAVIHCRDAHQDMRDVLNSFGKEFRGVIHSFTGTWDDAQAYINMGFHIGFNGIITFAREYDETVKNIPIDRVLLETDAPFLTPIPRRGKRNEPAYVVEVAKKLAELRGLELEEINKVTTYNAINMFINKFISKNRV